MKQKMRHLYRFLLVFGCLALGSKTMVAQNMFDDLFKGFDFDSFLKDMEKAYDEDADRKTFGTAAKAPGAPMMAGGTERTIITQTPTHKPQTKEELFLTPITQTIQEKGKPAKTTLSPESRNAFKEVMHDFIMLLAAVTTKVDASRIFSMPFKEQFLQYHDAIDKIVIAYGTMVSKKMYATLMPFQQPLDPKAPKPAGQQAKAPQPKEAATLRQNILNAIKELREIDKDLSAALEAEEKDIDEPILKELSKRPRTKITFDHAPISKSSKRKSRGSRDIDTKKHPPKKKEITEPVKSKVTVKQPGNVLPKEVL